MTPRAAARMRSVTVLLLSVFVLVQAAPGAVADEGYKRVSGSGSTWSENALRQWISNVRQYGMTIDYAGTGSSTGRAQFANGTVDFAVSEIPFGVRDGASVEPVPNRRFAYMPIVAGGTSFMYNLTIGGKRVTSLRLSGESVAGIFTGAITMWNDPKLAADNPGLALPAKRITPVVRSDGSGTTAQFTAWLVAKQGGSYGQLCAKANRSPCTQTSNYPALDGMVSKSGSDGVAGFVRQAQNDGSITYVEYSYANNAGFPVAKVLNDAGYYTRPTAQNVAVGLLGAGINTDAGNPATYLTQKLEGVYSNKDPRAYPLSSYSYMILPVSEEGTFTADKGKTLGAFAYYFLCTGQQQAEVLGYSPLPINLVQAGFDQVRKIPGVQAQNITVQGCNNPTFSPSGENILAKNAPQPPACDKQGPAQCDTGAAGAGAAGAGGGSGSAQGKGGASTRGPTSSSAGGAGAAGASGPGAGGGAGSGSSLGGDAASGDGLVVGADGTVLAGGSGGAMAKTIDVGEQGGWQSQHTLMLLAFLAVLMVVLGPPLLMRQTGGRP